MTAPAPPNPQSAPRASRPSLMSAGAPARPADGGDDDQGFSVSILSAAGGQGRSAEPGRPRTAARSRWRAVLWWLGIGGVALALLAVAHWQQRRPDAPAVPLAAVVAAPAVPTAASAVASEAAPVLALADAAASAVPAAAPASMPNPFDKIAETTVAPVPAPAVKPAVKPAPVRTAAAPATKPASPTVRAAAAPPRDRDAELVAAVMAHADAGREITLPAPRPPAPLSAAERNRFAAELRQCQQRHPGNAGARDACRAQACQSRGYAGRTKSCPATVAKVADATAGAASRPGP